MGKAEEATLQATQGGRLCTMYKACPGGSLSDVDEGGRIACLSGSWEFGHLVCFEGREGSLSRLWLLIYY